MIEARGLTKDYGSTRAVDDLTFTVRPGIVTGFLGPNGAGKSTAIRLVLGLDAPIAVEVTVNGKRYRDFPAPLHEIGAVLEARSVHGGRSARNHLLALAQTHGIPSSRVDEVVDLVGLHTADRRPPDRDRARPAHRRRQRRGRRAAGLRERRPREDAGGNSLPRAPGRACGVGDEPR